MTFKKYNKKMEKYAEKLSKSVGSKWDSLYKKISAFQQKYMERVLAAYKKSIDCKEKECIYKLLCHAIRVSESGSSIIDVDKDTAVKIEEILWEEIGDYLLDYEIYEENGLHVIDCMFAGYFVPYWDGWCEI